MPVKTTIVDDRVTIILLSLTAALLGCWELVITRTASVLFFISVTHLVLALSLLGFSVGALLAGRFYQRLSLIPLVLLAVLLLAPCWWVLAHYDLAWATGSFTLPFAAFGAASTLAWREIEGRFARAVLYLGESAGTVAGLVLLGPLVVALLPVNVLGTVGFDNHLRSLVAKEGLTAHEQVTTPYATTDLIRTKQDAMVYLFTDAMFVTRSVAWNGQSRQFEDEQVENLARLKRLAFDSSATGQVLLLGAGAGFDMAVALQHGAAQIDAVEINPQTIAFADSLDDWAGGILTNPRVNVRIDEARRFVNHENRQWDHINLTLLQTSPSTGRGYSHVDARVLTREAIRSYLQHLKPDGVLAIIQNSSMLADRTRATILSVIASPNQLQEWQLPDAEHKTNPFNHLLLVRNEAFSDLDTKQLSRAAVSLGIELRRPGTLEKLSPVTDDRPFLFESAIQSFTHSLAAASLAGLVLLLIFAHARRQNGHIRIAVSSVLVGAVLLAAQVLIIYRVQAALGNPALALSVALASTLTGAGAGALAFHAIRRDASWVVSGLASTSGCLVLALFGEAAVQITSGMEQKSGTFFMAGFVVFCSLPLGLPFLAVMDTGKISFANTESLIIACDGIGGVIGAALASIVAMLFGFNLLASSLVVAMLIFTAAGFGTSARVP